MIVTAALFALWARLGRSSCPTTWKGRRARQARACPPRNRPAELRSLPRARRRLVIVVGALVIVLVAGVLSSWWRAQSRWRCRRPVHAGSVIVVPGYGGSRSDLAPIVESSGAKDATAIVFQPTEGGTGDLRVQARRLADLAQRTIDRTGVASVDVVGYSAGGVIARLFVQRRRRRLRRTTGADAGLAAPRHRRRRPRGGRGRWLPDGVRADGHRQRPHAPAQRG